MRKILTSSLLVLLVIISGCAQQRRANQEGTIVLLHVTIIDATGAPPEPGMTVVITGSRIAAIGKDGKLKLPGQAQQINATGKFLIPGLWDMHVHLDDKEVFFPLFLANGVTGLRDMGVSKEVFESLKQLRQQIAKGQLLGPRFVTPGPMLDGPRSFPPVEKIFLTTESEAREAVRWLKQNGSDFVKVHSFPSREVYFAIADEAKKQGLTLTTGIQSCSSITRLRRERVGWRKRNPPPKRKS